MTPLLPAFTGAPDLNRVYHCDALTLLRALPDASVDLILTDPPYNIGKAAWDSWPSDADFLAWLDGILAEYRRVLKANGSLYLFCATRLSARIEIGVSKHFSVLNNIRWQKPAFSTKAEMFDKESMRAYFPASEACIFAEQYGTDYEANGRAYEPLKAWFRARAKTANLTNMQFNAALNFATNGSGVAGSIIGDKVEFFMPSESTYARIQTAFPDVFDREYSALKSEYEDLRREYEDLRRPFNATPERPYTDVWHYKTVNTYPNKHICEKPLDMMRDIVRISSRPDALVLDTFAGSGNSLRAARELGRRWLGCDADLLWAERANRRIDAPIYHQYDMFALAELQANGD